MYALTAQSGCAGKAECTSNWDSPTSECSSSQEASEDTVLMSTPLEIVSLLDKLGYMAYNRGYLG